MRRQIITAIRYTLLTTILFGLVYPSIVTGLAQVLFRDQANGQLLYRGGTLIGSRLIGQAFTTPAYFHSRPSNAGSGYDAANSSGSNLGPTSKKLLDRISADTAAAQTDHPGAAVPVDLITASASGLDPDITPAAAAFQVDRVAGERHLSPDALQKLVAEHTQARQFGLLGEPRVNVLELNLALDNLK